MEKLHRVTPWRTEGFPTWYATFYDVSGKRVTRSLRTRDPNEADIIARALALLRRAQPRRPLDAPPSMPARALALYFGEAVIAASAQRTLELATPLAFDDLAPDPADPNAIRIQLGGSEIARRQLELDVSRAHDQIAALERDLIELRASVLGQAVEAGRRCPPMAEALVRFEAHMRAASSSLHWAEMARAAKKFVATLPAAVKTPTQITAEHIGRWLDDESQGVPSPVVRRHRNRIRVGRFINWCARTWGYASPMGAVRPTPAGQLAREADEIHWHELAEVEAALALLAPYWRAVVATLAFAGLRLAELAWLRRSDIELPRGQIVVTTVDDGHGERHRLKTGRSRRAVQVEARLLAPLLDQHLAEIPSEVFAFPMPPGVRRRRRESGHPERWRLESLSRRLTGSSCLPGILPEGMSARSLRRTFGSLLLRSGRSVEEVAAAMGNTSDVVRRHYARILGSEVAVAFGAAPETGSAERPGR